LLTRSIDREPFDLPIGEKFFRGAKRVCIVFALSAVAISALDLLHIRSVTDAAEFVFAGRQRVADLLDLIGTGIQRIALASPSQSPFAVAMIPRDEIAMMPPLAPSAAANADVVNDAASVAEPVAARDLDAVDVASEPLPVSTTSQPSMVAAPAAEPARKPVMLASADPDSLPVSPITATPVSLPMSAAIPPDTVAPPPAPAAPPSPAELLHLEGDAYANAARCLANAIYFEARAEDVSGQAAVAQVVMNRVFSGFYPNDVCAVVYQNANRHRKCQFSFACDGKRKVINERGAWARANRIAKQTLDGKLYVAAVGSATHYHAVYVHPNWVREMRKMVRYGIHNFYRPIAWGDGANEPVWGTAALTQRGKN
jgi:spore germination cell wall hydrolase CwlJ-like protein